MTNRNKQSQYIDLDGNAQDLSVLDSRERDLVDDLAQFAAEHPDSRTCEYDNYFVRRVGDFYETRGLSRRETTKTTVWKVAQDIASRMMVEAGLARAPSGYRAELEALIARRFGSRREFCKATGISEDMLSHVLAKRKNIGIETLSDALARIGYTINIVPVADSSQPM